MYQNRITLIGFLGKDAEVPTTDNSGAPQGGGALRLRETGLTRAECSPCLGSSAPCLASLCDTIALGDCVELMRQMPAATVDFILTDPPYLVDYRSRDGRAIQNDADDRWLKPAFAEAHRVLRSNRFCVCFYGWSKADKFIAGWRAAGFRPVGHLVFRKGYASATRFLRYQHEQAYLLAKGEPQRPEHPISDVLEMRYTGNKVHPTQKAVSALLPLIETFSSEGDVVLDPFCGSGSTLVAARHLRRHFIGMELDPTYHALATRRIQNGAA